MRTTLCSWDTILAKLGLTRRKQCKRGRRNYLARRPRLELLEDRQLLATVTTNLDITDPNDGLTTLREAIITDTLNGGTVDFAPSLNGLTITLDRREIEGYGQISFGKNLTIDGTVDRAGPSQVSLGITIDGNDPSTALGNGIRIFNITDPTGGTAPPLVTLDSLTLTRGDAGASLFTADGDDDGDVDADDYTILTQNFGHTLQLVDVLL